MSNPSWTIFIVPLMGATSYLTSDFVDRHTQFVMSSTGMSFISYQRPVAHQEQVFKWQIILCYRINDLALEH